MKEEGFSLEVKDEDLTAEFAKAIRELKLNLPSNIKKRKELTVCGFTPPLSVDG